MTADDGDGALVQSRQKQQRTTGGALIISGGGGGAVVAAGPQRTSELLAPIMLLSGHGAAVHTSKFSPDGLHLLSGSHDKTLLVWETFGECRNVLTLKGHGNAVLEAHWLGDGEHAISASADRMVALWDVKTGGRVRLFKGHTSYVNSCCPAAGAPMLVSGADDSAARIWDTRVRTCQRVLAHPLPVTAVSASASGNEVYTGCVDGAVRVFDLRKGGDATLKLSGHDDIITGLSLSPDGHRLLSNGMDNTLRCWDVRPFCNGNRCEKVFLGAQHNYEKGLLKCNW